ncbi:MAG: hypothetical protein K6E37_10045 [Bacteroidales bacterium]|nr:hypothetical protein [Bacteroidales bacterium]
MDVELLTRMVGDLILDHDVLDLPGLGSFVAQDMPASFSDRGYTINPPYRRLSFSESESGDGLLAELYARDNGLSRSEAALILEEFLSGLAATLREEKAVDLPGLGRLRATRENHFFFVADEDLDISPDACGLDSVSLKTHRPVSLPDIPAAAVPPAPGIKMAETFPPEEKTADLGIKAAETFPPEEKTADLGTKSPDSFPPEEKTAESGIKAAESFPLAPKTPVPATNQAENVADQPESPAPEAIEARPEATTARPEATEAQPELPGIQPEAIEAPETRTEATETRPEPESPAPARPRRRLPAAARWAIGVAACAALLLGGFVLLSRIAPDFTDKLLYTEEELAIINNPEDGVGLPG